MATVQQDVPPPQAGDCLSREEFMRRWEAHPEIKKAELINGIVFMPSPRLLEHAESSNGNVPPLEFGDNLSQEEFIRRWNAHPEIKFAELLGGVVYMPSPLSFAHGSKDNHVGTWIGVYEAFTPGTAGAKNATMYMSGYNPQPDSMLFILPECGGKARWKDKFVGGIPDFFAETCATSAAYDLHQKLEIYEKAGVPEYLAVLVDEQEIRWHVLENGKYQLMPPAADGVWHSRVFPGLWLDGVALLAGKLAKVLEKLNEGLATPEHQAFVEKLQAARLAT